ncbi:MAG: Deoxyribodipyrimidine photo-lyase [candidate division BRC1 bacterium ADurb.BinA364]|nr:MAG: Deoxyribodipyrimidine photo-lyase [candidate division BRC1 bacterium ADurb.BinA364]
MRQLLETGWMHNRARMIAASFLVKDLAQPWQAGARWFWERLIDADLANNTLGWQWCAGCGADAQPFFRIFNPALQAEKFDAEGKYIRAWVEELQNPLEGGREYPAPIVDHAVAARQALAAYRALKRR